MRLLTVLLALIVVPSFACAQQLAVNPGFEEADENGFAAGWEVWPDTPAAGSVLTLDENMPHTGRTSLRITQTNPIAYSRVQQRIAVEPNTSYLFHVWVKGEELEPGDGSQGARLYIEKSTGDTACRRQEGTFGWKQVRLGPVEMKSSSRITLMFYLHRMTGTVWVDDIEMIKVTDDIEHNLAQEKARTMLWAEIAETRSLAEKLGDVEAQEALGGIWERGQQTDLPLEVDHIAGPPFYPLHAEVFGVMASLNRKVVGDGGPVTAWVTDPFVGMRALQTVPEEREMAASCVMGLGERDQCRVNLSNTSEAPVDLRVAVDDFGGEGAPVVTLREVRCIDPGNGALRVDPLPLMAEADGAHRLTLQPGLLSGVWLDISSAGASAGMHSTVLRMTPDGGDEVRVPVSVEVLPVTMPDEKPITTWGYSYEHYWIMPQVWDLAKADLVAHHIDAYCWPSKYVPFPELNEDGTLKPLDWAAFEAGVASHPPMRWLLLWPGFEWEGNLKLRLELEPNSDEWKRVARLWFRALIDGLDERGFGLDRVAWYLTDEAISSGRANATAWTGAIINEVSPESLVMSNPYRAAPFGLLRQMDPVVNLWCPALHFTDPEHLEFFREGCDVLWTYQVLGKGSGAFAQHRLSFWDCWNKGITGQGFWCYADAQGSAWNPYDEGRGDYSPVYDGDEREMIPSLRWEAWREGVEDYTYLWMLREAVERGAGSDADRAQASALLDELPGRVLAEGSPETLATARRQVLEALVRLR